MRTVLVLLAAASLAACATSPRQSLASLNQSDPQYRSGDCIAARKAVADYDDNKDGRAVIGLVGNLIVPFAGTAAALAMDRLKEDDRKALVHQVRAACTSDPLKGKTRVARP